jgi:hypothetical protein
MKMRPLTSNSEIQGFDQIFDPPYANNQLLEADHLDAIAKWAASCSYFAAACAFGPSSWGILSAEASEAHVEGDEMSSGSFAVWDEPEIHWGRITVKLPNGPIGVLSPGSLTLDTDPLLYVRPRTNAIGFALDVVGKPDPACVPVPLLQVVEKLPISSWPVAFLGATPSLRSKLVAFTSAARDTFKELDTAQSRWEPVLAASLCLLTSTHVGAGMPLLGSLAIGLHLECPIITGQTSHWPPHHELERLLTDLTAALARWKRPIDLGDPQLVSQGMTKKFGGHPGRRYTKRAGIEVIVCGFTEKSAASEKNWAIARWTNDTPSGPIPKVKVPSEWTEFVVYYPLAAEPQANAPLRFRVGDKFFEV